MLLEYTVKREYTVPHLTAYFSAFSIVAIATLVVLNVVLQGYNVVTILRPDPNITESYWWSVGAVSLRSAGKCSPVSLLPRSMITTNSSLFSYEILSTFDASRQNIAGGSSYTANPLRNCTVDAIAVDINVSRRAFSFDVPILCISIDLPYSLSLTSKFSINLINPYYDDIASIYLQNRPSRESLYDENLYIQRNASSSLNIIAVLDALSRDLETALDMVVNASIGNIPSTISTGGFLACPGDQNTVCQPEDKKMIVPASVVYYPNGTAITTWNGIGPFLSPIEANFLNMFTVLQDAYHIDFGNIQPSNTLLSMQAFSSRIQTGLALSAVAHNTSGFSICAWGIGCVHGSTWTDQLLRSNPDIRAVIPSILPAGKTSAVANVDYLCPVFKIKRYGSLITSVFIGTWSMYMALVGLFGVVGPMLEKRYGRVRIEASTNAPTLGYETKH